MTMNRITVARTAAIIMLAGFTATISARPDAPLAGPRVKDRNVPGTANTFGEGMPMDPAKRTRPVPPRLFFETVRELADESAPPDLRLSADQRDQCRAIADEFREAAEAFRDEHRDEIRALRGRAGELAAERRGARNGPDAPPPPPDDRDRKTPTPEQQTAREQLRELMRKGPQPDAYFARVWEVLNDEQEAFVRERIEEEQQNRMMQREAPIAREAVRDRIAEQDPRLKEWQGLSREEIREKLQALPPEERDRIREKLRAAREQSGNGSRRRAEDRPPPTSDEIDVPAP